MQLTREECTYWLCQIKGIGRKRMQIVLEALGNPRNAYYIEETALKQKLPEQITKLLTEGRNNWSEKKIHDSLERLLERGIDFLPYGSQNYPERLMHIPDPPLALYAKGRAWEEKLPSVAIVGARECSAYGSQMAQWFGRELAKEGIAIISGMARGIDSISQNAALMAGGFSCAVLGCGVDICYPGENYPLFEKLQKKGCLLSEYAPGTAPASGLFPARNRIISGLSDILLVVEARERSGTLITVDMALEQGKDVFVIPGRITDSLSTGCNRLIKSGAEIAFSPRDILEALSIKNSTEAVRREIPCKKLKEYAELSVSKKLVYEALDFYPKNLEEIRQLVQSKAPMELSEISAILMELCLEGKARQNAGGSFEQRIVR